MGVVKKSHPRGFIIKRLFHTEQIYLFLTLSLQITSGEISADERQGRAEAKQRNITDKKLSRQSAHQKRLQSLQKYSSKISNNPSLNSIHQYTHQSIIQPLITPTLRSASGQGERPGSRTLRGVHAVSHEKCIRIKRTKMQKTSKNTKLRKNLKTTLKRGIILVRTSRFWYDNGMLWYCNCCFEIMNDHKKIVKI